MNVIELLPGMTLPGVMIDTEVYSPGLVRKTTQPGSHPTDIAITVAELGELVEHCLIHDVGDVEWWSDEIGGDLYDVTVYNVGWSAPDRGHGHGLYTQNLETSPVRVVRNSVFVAGFKLPAKVYAESEQPVQIDGQTVWVSKLANYVFRECVFVGGPEAGVYVGNINPDKKGAINVVFEDCIFINCDVNLGYKGPSRQIVFKRNTIIGGTMTLGGQHDGTVIQDNVLVVTKPMKFAINCPVTPAASYVSTGNVIYSDDATLFEPEWTLPIYLAQGRDPWGWTDVRPLAAYPGLRREITIPEKNARILILSNLEGRAQIELDGEKRIRDVRRWHDPYIGSAVVMAGEPEPPLNWDTAAWGPAPVPANTLPLVGVFRIEEISLEERLNMANARIAEITAALAALQRYVGVALIPAGVVALWMMVGGQNTISAKSGEG